MKNFLIIQTAFLGDVVLATALAESLHTAFPEIKISMLVREGNEGLLKNHPFLHEVLIWKKKSGKAKGLLDTIATVRKNKYDTVINLQRFFSSGLITVFSGAKTTSGFDKNPWSAFFTHVSKHVIGDGRHEVDRNHRLMEFTGTTVSGKPKLYPSESDFEKSATYKSRPYVTIAPASVWFTKQLPTDKWLEIINTIPDETAIYLLGATTDQQLCEKIRLASGIKNVVTLAGELNLLQMAALMRDAVMNYVNDSAPMHIASAMNAPVTVFFCSTIPEFGFGPLSDHSVIVETQEKLSCRPCGLHGKSACPLGHFKCATTIQIPAA